MSIDVSFVLPCLNEVLTMEHCINNANEAGKLVEKMGLSYEIVISDNGSTDGSQDLARKLGAIVIDCPDRGYGNALDYGMRNANGKYLMMGDCDGSYNFIEGVPMIEKLEQGYELCMGTRLKGVIKEGAMPWKNRYIGNPALSGIMNLFFKTGLSDAHCGLRAFTKEAYLKMNMISTGMEYATEMVVKATQYDLKRCEVPITLSPDLRDRPPHLNPWRDGWRHLKFMLMFSPEYIFIVPAIFFLMVGLIVNFIIIGLGSDFLGIHSLIVADFSIVSAVALIAFATINFTMGYQVGIRNEKEFLYKIYKYAGIEQLGVVSLSVMLIGSYMLLGVIFTWVGSFFGDLDRSHTVLTATTLIASGGIFFLSTFLTSIIKDGWMSIEQKRK